MNANSKFKTWKVLVFGVGLLLSGICSAHVVVHHGGHHGGVYRHGGGYYHGGYYGGHRGVYYRGGSYYGGRYIAPGCRTVRTCSPYGHCWLNRVCN